MTLASKIAREIRAEGTRAFYASAFSSDNPYDFPEVRAHYWQQGYQDGLVAELAAILDAFSVPQLPLPEKLARLGINPRELRDYLAGLDD